MRSVANLTVVVADGRQREMVIKTWEQNIFAPLQMDKQIKHIGLSLLNELNMSDIERFIG